MRFQVLVSLVLVLICTIKSFASVEEVNLSELPSIPRFEASTKTTLGAYQVLPMGGGQLLMRGEFQDSFLFNPVAQTETNLGLQGKLFSNANDAREFAVVGNDDSIALFNRETGEKRSADPIRLTYLRSDQGDYISSALSPSGQYLLIGGLYHKLIRRDLWNSESQEIKLGSPRSDWISSMKFVSPEEALVLSQGKVLFRVHVPSRESDFVSIPAGGLVEDLHLSKDRAFVTGSFRGIVEINPRTQEVVQSIQWHERINDEIKGFATLSNGRKVLLAHLGNVLTIYEYPSFTPLLRVSGKTGLDAEWIQSALVADDVLYLQTTKALNPISLEQERKLFDAYVNKYGSVTGHAYRPATNYSSKIRSIPLKTCATALNWRQETYH